MEESCWLYGQVTDLRFEDWLDSKLYNENLPPVKATGLKSLELEN